MFDFRIYLSARQAEMLFHLGRTVEVAKRGAYFVSTFARTLREHQVRTTAICSTWFRFMGADWRLCRTSWDKTLWSRGLTPLVSTSSRPAKNISLPTDPSHLS